MFPKRRLESFLSHRFPRVSGDVSTTSEVAQYQEAFSPRERGCFTSVRRFGMPPVISPRGRGCFSSMLMKDMPPFFSPRKWGGLSYCVDFFFLKVITRRQCIHSCQVCNKGVIMRKIFFRLTKDLFPLQKDRFPYVYLEHGRLEIDDSSVKWIGADGAIVRLPVATIGSLLLGPGTTVTHAAIEAVSTSGCTLSWVGAESFIFYAYGMPPTADTQKLSLQGRLAFNELTRLKVARNMFASRFPGIDLSEKSLPMLMGMEGVRVRALYARLSAQYGVPWSGRSFVPGKPQSSDAVNRCLTFLNSLLYGVITSSLLSGGYSPRIGFIHSGSPMPFVYDIADLYKANLTIDLAFKLVAEQVNFHDKHVLIDAFSDRLVEECVLETVLDTVGKLLKVE